MNIMKPLCLLGLMLAAAPGARLGHRSRPKCLRSVPGANPVTVEHIKVHGAALEGNLEGDAVDRDVFVFLPPSYATAEAPGAIPSSMRLHGYSIGAEQWTHEIHVPQTIEGAFAQGAKEMIVVLPDSKTVHNGSMYSSSVTTGDFERFVAHDLVAYIDAHYRTIPTAHEPGPGWPLHGRLWRHPHRHEALGRLRQPVHHEPVLPVADGKSAAGNAEIEKALEAVKTPADSANLPWGRARRMLASAAAWAPESEEPAALSRSADEGRQAAAGHARQMAANAPLAFIDQYIGNLRSIRAISIDVGDQDGLKFGATKLHEILDNYGIANGFEIYHGTHTSAVADRFQNHVLPFFSKNLHDWTPRHGPIPLHRRRPRQRRVTSRLAAAACHRAAGARLRLHPHARHPA
jgi:hypothetical protein